MKRSGGLIGLGGGDIASEGGGAAAMRLELLIWSKLSHACLSCEALSQNHLVE